MYLGYQLLIRYIICKYLLPFNRLAFRFVDGFLCRAEAFYMDVVPFVYLCFCRPCLRRHNPQNCAKNGVKGPRAYFILGVL